MTDLNDIVNIEAGNQPESTAAVTGDNLANNHKTISFQDDVNVGGSKAGEEDITHLADEDHVHAMADQGPNFQKYDAIAKMESYKEKGSFALPEDVYAFITVASVCTWSFAFAVSVICIKYIVYGALLFDILDKEHTKVHKRATAVKFFLIPVAVAMQEDLMGVFAGVANSRYDPKVLAISPGATRAKFCLGHILRFVDGSLSLCVNYMLMLRTAEVLNVFLNFAALHFLQDIDDVFYALVVKGFFGDKMELMSNTCRQVSWPRRRGSNKLSALMTDLDTILFTATLLLLYSIYFYITIKYEIKPGNDAE
mmetsp:Transcript_16182/g.35152  ORF Transcript_16182/g.35152 Transcript_16182/m.35152 type:complete len:310 (+) Transcript_16182:217-1146(+)|eukprot:CAMPEP_0168181170 /NCGR_PEP_ID=MMETSP0139_2-20121125/11040_1 /TAXON_ID=44445 /ORGANISM="Pseudo-nitzschia australis, Strain 10249 10 AB" /LENGTH=309 /DNA_ID=CAMNT_0008101661 /DNA_START=178 /DNA_END=1107 /DNA_ORIENTATION=+